tara:strand:+ start:1566 stop:1943 length:378 start_codon:yes stop_codon:yes gene_type:complete
VKRSSKNLGVSYGVSVVLVGFILTSTTGCEAHPQPPEICIDMCEAAADLYGSCLDGWGVSWIEAGFKSEDSFLGSCETWSWEQSILNEDISVVEAVCIERLDQINIGIEDNDCTAYTEIDWNESL